MKKTDSGRIYALWKAREDGRFTDATTGRTYLRPDVVASEYPYLRTCGARYEISKLGRPPLVGKDPIRIWLDGCWWLADDALRDQDDCLEGNSTRPVTHPRGTLLPSPAIVELGISEDTWNFFCRVRRVHREQLCISRKSASGKRLMGSWRYYSPKSEVDAFLERAARLANSPTVGPMKAANEIADAEGIPNLLPQLRNFLAFCAVRHWISRVSAERGWTYDFGAYRELLGKPLLETGEKRTFAKRRRARKPAEITAKQVEAFSLVMEHKGNIRAAARAGGVSYFAMRKRYLKACKKLGKKAVAAKPKTHRIPTDKRGQSILAVAEMNVDGTE